MKMMHLNVKSGFSFFHSALKVDDIVNYAKENKLPAIALTDINNMFGAIDFYYKCKEAKIKPLIGIEVLIKNDEINFPLIMLAKNNEGYLILLRLASLMENDQKTAFLDINDLSQYSQDVIAILPHIRATKTIKENDQKTAIFDKVSNLFSDFYLGLELLIDDSKEYLEYIDNYQTCFINEVRYERKQDAVMGDILSAIQKNIKLSDLNRNIVTTNYFLEKEEIEKQFPKAIKLLKTNEEIASKINYDFSKIRGEFIEYPNNRNLDNKEFLRALTYKGLARRLNNNVPDYYRKRLNYELDIIINTNYHDYFLVVYDYVKYAKQNNILVGPGRGSAAASLVSYVLGITDVDPIKYNLLFERFLNPERISMPDIDIDFEDDKRDEVINYIFEKYGKERSAHIIAFQTFAARQSMRDAAKTLGLDLKEVDVIAKRIPKELNVSLKYLYEKYPDFKAFINSRKIYQQVFNVAHRLEGLPRQTTVHAAGIVINNKPLIDVIPTLNLTKHSIITQYDMTYLEQLGILKLDLLGLKNLSIIKSTLDLIKKTTNKDLSFANINLNDHSIYQILQSGQTLGLFQLESKGMQRAIRSLKPANFEDIVALLALFRPGPIENLDTYVRRKEGKEQINYYHPKIKDILTPTYGIIVYQEQIMQILQQMAGFSYAKADIIRRAITTKEEKLMLQIKNEFISGCLKNDIDYKVASEVYSMIQHFANYGFNRAHSVSYAFISAKMAYLKANYPLEFYASLLNSGSSFSSRDTKFHEVVKELKKAKVILKPPSVNKPSQRIEVEKNSLRLSLLNIKGLNNQLIKTIIGEKEKRGPYKDFLDFCVRLIPQNLTKEALISLIKVGTFDEFGLNRATLLNSINLTMQYAEIITYIQDGELYVNYEISEKPNYETLTLDEIEEAEMEFDILGFILKSKVFERMSLKKQGYVTINEIKTYYLNKNTKASVIVSGVEEFLTKSQQKMAVVTVFDETDTMEILVFPDIYEKRVHYLNKGNKIEIKGYLQKRQKIQFVINEIEK